MNRIFAAAMVAISLTLAGCAGTPIGRVLEAATSTVTNPVSAVDVYRAKLVYDGALELAVTYRRYCYSKPYAVLMKDPVAKPACQNRRATVRALQAAESKSFAAISVADNFVRNNPTLNASSVIGAAWTAVSEFQAIAANASVPR